MNKNAKVYSIVTGASQGLGLSFAKELASRGKNLIITSLPGENLIKTGNEIKEKYGVEVACFETDFAKHNSVYDFAEWINNRFQVETLINNAGVGGTAAFDSTEAEYIDTIIQINVRTVSILTKLLMKNLQRQEKAYILNVASMASFSPIPFKTVYPASKTFVYVFSRTLYEELKGTNVFVSVVHPGPMMTNETVSKNIIKQGWIGKMGLVSTDKIAHISIRQLYRRDSLILPGALNKVNWILMKTLPIWFQLYLGATLTKRELELKA